ncbi:MAG: hypothetical protein B6D56_06170 [Candidatus Omnitrophica bacterium 4484_70.1]|nr:MAG: hypothetical protein B6D56_06170 [Candidatus Omnitrophica bacterium 4484_70.1]
MSLLSIGISNQEIYYALLKKKELLLGKASLSEFTSSAFAQLIEKIIEENNITPSKIFFSIFRDDVLVHQLTLPKMSRTEAEEVILGEVEKIPSFSGKDFEYVYSLFDMGNKKSRVIFSSVFQNTIDTIIETAKSINISLENIEIVPLNILTLLYNLTPTSRDEALIVLDEKVSHVMIFFNQKCKLFYTAGVGISDFFFKGKVDNLTFSNWIEELRRIFKSYCMEYKKEDVNRVWLVWDEDKAPLLDQLLSQELGKEIKRIDVSALIDVSLKEEFNPIYAGVVSPIISYLKNYRSEFHFERFLREIKIKRVVKKGVLFLSIYSLVVGGILGSLFFTFFTKTGKEKKNLERMEAKVKRLKKKTEELRRKRDEYKRIKERLLRQAFYVRQLNRIPWSRVFGEVAENLPEGIALSSFNVSESGKVEFKGEALKIDVIAKLMRRLEHLTVIEKPRFNFLREAKIEEKKIFNFGILANLKREKGKINEKK